MGLKPGVLILLPLLFGHCRGCTLESCQLPDEEKRNAGGPQMCLQLKEFNDCIQKTERVCKGNLRYHLLTTFFNKLVHEHNCSREGWRTGGRRKECTLKQTSGYRHCALFGDPHLKTFAGIYQTCRIQGAWPLIDNRYLNVQVTNTPVLDSSLATATTKVTVIIRGRASPCASKKTYEATSDAPLPEYFIDGSDRAGPSGSISLKYTEEGQNQKVEIYLKYIDTTLIIRRVGEYLGFSGRFPKEVLDKTNSSEMTELCRWGCPSNELLDLSSAGRHKFSWDAAKNKCKDNSNINNEIQNNLTDHYLDWCVFDLMATGNQNDFISAAHSAQADVLKLDPESLLNRTEPKPIGRYLPSSGAVSLSCFITVTLLTVINL